MAAGGHTGGLSGLPLLPRRLHPRAWVPGPARSQCSVSTKQSHASHKQDRTQRSHSRSCPVPGHGPPRTVTMPLPRCGARGQRGRLAPGRVEGEPAAKTDLSPRPCAHYAHRPDPRAWDLTGGSPSQFPRPFWSVSIIILQGGRTHFWVTGMLREGEQPTQGHTAESTGPGWPQVQPPPRLLPLMLPKEQACEVSGPVLRGLTVE